MLITIGSVTGVSIAALFTGGLLPALVLAHRAVRRGVAGATASEDLSRRASAPAARDRPSFRRSPCPALALPFVIRAAVVEGVATATEVSTIGIVYALARGPAASIASSTGGG